MKFVWLDGGVDDEYNSVGFVELFKIFAMQDAMFFVRESFNRVYAAIDQ